MDFSNLEYKYEFEASPTELTTVGEVSDVVEWIEFKLTVKATYEGQEYEGGSDGLYKITKLRDLQESYDSDDSNEREAYSDFANNAAAVEDIDSAKIMQWMNWNSGPIKSIRTSAIENLHDVIIAANQTETEDSESSITFVN